MYFAVYFGVFEDDHRQVNTSVRQHAHPAQEDQISRLQSLGFRLSPSQLCTTADGNCICTMQGCSQDLGLGGGGAKKCSKCESINITRSVVFLASPPDGQKKGLLMLILLKNSTCAISFH